MKIVKSLLSAFWKDERGFIVSAELVLIGTIAVLSMVVGLSAVSRAITNELIDMAQSFDSVNQNDGHDRYGRQNDHRADIVRR